MSLIQLDKLIGHDLETRGDEPGFALQPFRSLTGQAAISAASFCRHGGEPVGVLNPSTQLLKPLLRSIADRKLTIVGWNIAFDAAWLIAAGLEDEVMACSWFDTMLLWRHWFIEPEGEDVPKKNRKSYSLEAAMMEFFPEDAGFKEFKNFQATDEASLLKLLYRNKEDARYALKFVQLFWDKLTPQQQVAAFIESRCIPLVAWTKVHGIGINREMAEKLDTVLEAKAIEVEAKLLAAAPEAEGINFGSAPQLQKLLYETWGLPVQGRSRKTDAPSTDKFALFELAFIDPRARMLKELREAKNNRVKYAQGTLKSLDYNGDGKVRPDAKIFGTYTSRMTYSSSQRVKRIKVSKKGVESEVGVEVPTGIALHQWKRGKDYRSLITPPPGYGLLELDAAGQEFRWMAVASGDPTMLSLCEPGEDGHSYMGAQIAKIDYRELIRRVHAEDKEAELQRKLGKFSNLSFQYRVSAKTATMKARVDYELDVDVPFVSSILATYKQSYPGVPQYWTSQISKCKMLGYAETFAGRRVQLQGNWSDKRFAWGLESTSINYPIQGTGGDQKYLALAIAKNHLSTYSGHFYYELHDGLFFIFPWDKIEKAAQFFRTLLSTLPYKQAWGFQPPIQFPFDGKIGPSWGELKEFK